MRTACHGGAARGDWLGVAWTFLGEACSRLVAELRIAHLKIRTEVAPCPAAFHE